MFSNCSLKVQYQTYINKPGISTDYGFCFCALGATAGANLNNAITNQFYAGLIFVIY